MNVFFRIFRSQAFRLVPASYWSLARSALTRVSCTRSSASARFRERRVATARRFDPCARRARSNSSSSALGSARFTANSFQNAVTGHSCNLFLRLLVQPLFDCREPVRYPLQLRLKLANRREIRKDSPDALVDGV